VRERAGSVRACGEQARSFMSALELVFQRLQLERVVRASSHVPGFPARKPRLGNLRPAGDFRLGQPPSPQTLDERLGRA